LVQHVVSKAPHIRFGGLQCYHGGNQHIRAQADRKAATEAVVAIVSSIVAELTTLNLKVPVITGGGTGTFEFEGTSGLYNEIQPVRLLYSLALNRSNQRHK